MISWEFIGCVLLCGFDWKVVIVIIIGCCLLKDGCGCMIELFFIVDDEWFKFVMFVVKEVVEISFL